MKLSDAISFIALIVSIGTFAFNYYISKKNKTIDDFSNIRINVLYRLDEITIEDVKEAYKTSNPNKQKIELNHLMRQLDMYCQIVEDGMYDYKLFLKLNRNLINSTKMIEKYKLIIKKMRCKGKAYFPSLRNIVSRINGKDPFE